LPTENYEASTFAYNFAVCRDRPTHHPRGDPDSAVWGGAVAIEVEQWGVWAPVGIFALRFTSVVIPALRGTAYAILAGGLLGFGKGVAVICVADICSCSLSFWLSRRYGRNLVKQLVGQGFMYRIDHFSQRHLERNFFLLTGCLMTGFFDFVCYGIGLTKAPWTKFLPALVISIALSNPPFVALGAGILEGGA